MFIRYTLVAIGGGLGSVGRFWLSGLIANKFGQAFPWGTLVINVSGSFVIGFFATLTDTGGRYLVSPDDRCLRRFHDFLFIQFANAHACAGRRVALRRRELRLFSRNVSGRGLAWTCVRDAR